MCVGGSTSGEGCVLGVVTHRVVPNGQQIHRQCTQPSAGRSHGRSRSGHLAPASRHTRDFFFLMQGEIHFGCYYYYIIFYVFGIKAI